MKLHFAILVPVFLTSAITIMAQQTTDDPIEAAALAAVSGSPQAVRMLTDTVIGTLPFTFHPAMNVNDRLFQAELLYRQKHEGVRLGQVVSGLNQFADTMRLPPYVKTNMRQVEMYRLRLLRFFPTLAGPPPHAPGQKSDLSLSPAAATFIVLQLLQLKLNEPSYQVDPDTWVNTAVASAVQHSSSVPRRTTTLEIRPRAAVSREYQEIAGGLAANNGPFVVPLLSLLAALGI